MVLWANRRVEQVDFFFGSNPLSLRYECRGNASTWECRRNNVGDYPRVQEVGVQQVPVTGDACFPSYHPMVTRQVEITSCDGIPNGEPRARARGLLFCEFRDASQKRVSS